MPESTVPPVERLLELGGIGSRGTLLRSCSRGDLDRALAAGDVVMVSCGLVALASVDEQQTTAARLGGTLALASAALHHGWAVKTVPDRPHVMISRGRRVTKTERRIVHVHPAELGDHEVVDRVRVMASAA